MEIILGGGIAIPEMKFFEVYNVEEGFIRASVKIDIADYTELKIAGIKSSNSGAVYATVKVIGVAGGVQTELYSTYGNASNLSFDITAYDTLLIACIGSTLYIKTITNLTCE